MVQSAKTIKSNPTDFKPIAGKNKLRFSIYSNLDGSHPLKGGYKCFVWSFLEFDAVAPIIMVHGTNANHTSWEEPTGDTIQGRYFYGFVPGAFNPSSYQGTWFYRIDLDPHWWINPYNGGNNGIDASGVELNGYVKAILNALGAKRCHIIAHSKGGSDSRSMINDKETGNDFVKADESDPEKLTNKYQVMSLYTIGTPHLGTPLSDMAYAVTENLFRNENDLVQSNDPNISAMISAVTTAAFLHAGPTRGALADQRTDARINEYDSDHTLEMTKGHFYSIVGDADLNLNNTIDEGEKSVLFPWYTTVSYAKADHIYKLLGSARKVNAQVKKYEADLVPYFELLIQPIDPTATTLEPNDLVTPFWSGIGPRAIPFQVNQIPFSVKTGHSAEPSVSSFEFSQSITPGNHSILKDVNTARAIIFNIINLDYKPKEEF